VAFGENVLEVWSLEEPKLKQVVPLLMLQHLTDNEDKGGTVLLATVNPETRGYQLLELRETQLWKMSEKRRQSEFLIYGLYSMILLLFVFSFGFINLRLLGPHGATSLPIFDEGREWSIGEWPMQKGGSEQKKGKGVYSVALRNVLGIVQSGNLSQPSKSNSKGTKRGIRCLLTRKGSWFGKK